MDVFEERYFSFNKRLFIVMGLWPFGPAARNIRKYTLLPVLFAMAMPHLISATINFTDMDRLMLNLVIFFIALLMFLKVLAMIAADNKMRALYRNIADNWLTIGDPREVALLAEYSERGRRKAVYYFAFTLTCSASLFALPTVAKMLDVVSPLPQPRSRMYILEGELLVDKQAHYWLYNFCDFVSIVLNASVSVSVDGMIIVCVEHCCAFYAIIKRRLRNLRSKISDSSAETEGDSYDYVAGIIRLHQNTLNFTGTVSDAFSMLFLYILIANIATIPLEAVTVLSNLDNPFNFIRFSLLLVYFVVHLFMLFWPGQNVLDHGHELIGDAYCNEWYAIPIRKRKMLVTFMIRCSRPTLLSAGGVMLMNFETFSMIVRTALSYITVVASFR